MLQAAALMQLSHLVVKDLLDERAKTLSGGLLLLETLLLLLGLNDFEALHESEGGIE